MNVTNDSSFSVRVISQLPVPTRMWNIHMVFEAALEVKLRAEEGCKT